jgi:hypothetical protein
LVIRASNFLIRQGEAAALHLLVRVEDGSQLSGVDDSTLRDFLALCPKESEPCLDLQWTLLACSTPDGIKLPPPLDGQYEDDPVASKSLSSAYPVLFEGDIPFLINHLVVMPSETDPRQTHSFLKAPLRDFIMWSLGHGSFRRSPLLPPDDPFEVAIAAIKRILAPSAQASRLGEDGARQLRELLLGQAFAMCEGCLDERLTSELGNRFKYKTSDVLIPACRRAATDGQMHWNVTAQRYVTVSK